jgi:peptidyl-tRNA hydrolase
MPHAPIHTQVDPGTVTVLAVGPAVAEDVDQVTGKLPLL